MADRAKIKRKTISLDLKIQILDRLASGQGSTSVGKHFGVHESTIRTIKKNETIIRKSVSSGSNLSAKRSSYTNDIVKMKMEKALVIWIENNSQNRVPLNGKTVKETAVKIYKQIQEMEPDTSSHPKRKHAFSASNGWLVGFFKRHALHNIETTAESEDELAAKEFRQNLSTIIHNGCYTADQVWKADETSLFWKRMPKKTYVGKSQKMACGFNEAKDRVTLLFCSNASGDGLLKPLIVTQTKKPRSLSGVTLNKLQVHWMPNKNAWVTSDIFNNWLNECFVPEVRNYLSLKGQEFKVILILDSALSFMSVRHPNIQICFLPQNTASLLKPLHQDIITTFKTYYVRRIYQYILEKLNDQTLTVMDVWMKFSIVDFINQVELAVSELEPTTLNECWETIWPECVTNTTSTTPYVTEFSNIITLGHSIGTEDFNDLSFNDINELLLDQTQYDDEEKMDVLVTPDQKEESENDRDEVNYDPIKDSDTEENSVLNVQFIVKGLKLAKKLGNYFVKHDPNKERAEKFQHNLDSIMTPYRELYYGLAIKRTQKLISEFTVKTEASKSHGTSASNLAEEISKIISPLDHEEKDQAILSDSSEEFKPKYTRYVSESDNE